MTASRQLFPLPGAEMADYLASHTCKEAATAWGAAVSTAWRWRQWFDIPEQLTGGGATTKKLFWNDLVGYLATQPVSCTESAIARHFHLSRQAVSLRCLRWEHAGWLRRTDENRDGRALGWVLGRNAPRRKETSDDQKV